jgi:hypothetical protein
MVHQESGAQMNIPHSSIEPFGVLGFPEPYEVRVHKVYRDNSGRDDILIYPRTHSGASTYEEFVKDMKEILKNEDT